VTDHGLLLSEAHKAAEKTAHQATLAEVEFSTLQAINGGTVSLGGGPYPHPIPVPRPLPEPSPFPPPHPGPDPIPIPVPPIIPPTGAL
jgi:hypothetical protein